MIEFKGRQPPGKLTRQRYAIKRALALLRHQRRLIIHGSCEMGKHGRHLPSTLSEADKANVEWYDDVITNLERAFRPDKEKGER